MSDKHQNGEQDGREELSFHDETIEHDFIPGDRDQSPIQSEPRINTEETDNCEPREGNFKSGRKAQQSQLSPMQQIAAMDKSIAR
eukprot:6801245-Karenia_brevis.AAC.1